MYYKTHPEVRVQDQGDGVYLVYFNQDIYRVNEVAKDIIEICRDDVAVERIVYLLLKRYDVEERQLLADVTEMLEQFSEMFIKTCLSFSTTRDRWSGIMGGVI